jgi:hypothetical protein
MAKCPAVAMSETDGAKPFLGHDDEPATDRWKQDSATRHLLHGRQSRASVFVATLLLIPLTIFFILYLQWHSAFEPSGSKLTEVQNHVALAGPERDLKFILHPEDHVSRDPETRYFSWNITKAAIAPNGAQKEVLLINSTANCYITPWLFKKMLTKADQFPGPTIEARSGDMLEIEIFNSAEEEVSLHWHGLHMRGMYTDIW